MNSEHAAKGSEHLQQAARELIGAARSFLDAAEELVEDSEFVDDAASAFRTVADDLASMVGRGTEQWQSSSGFSQSDRATQGSADGSADPDAGDGGTDPKSGSDVTGGVESTTAGGDDATSTRVRRIDVE